MARDKGLFNTIIKSAAQQITKDIKMVQELNTVPIGQEYMTPYQVKKRYGLGVQQIEDLIREHGEDVVRNEVLPILEARDG